VHALRLLTVGIVGVLAMAGCANPPAGAGKISASPTGPTLGRSVTADNGQVEATVFEYRQPVGDASSGSVRGAADVQVCVVSSAIFNVTISQGPWLVVLPDGSTVGSGQSGDAPQPGYPTDHRRLAPGQCIRGWLVFALPSPARPVAVWYAPTGSRPISWPVS
jgi:hypothetical protein